MGCVWSDHSLVTKPMLGTEIHQADQKTLIKVEPASYCSAGRQLLLCAALTDDLGGESET
jgi:hypothetical protein